MLPSVDKHHVVFSYFERFVDYPFGDAVFVQAGCLMEGYGYPQQISLQSSSAML